MVLGWICLLLSLFSCERQTSGVYIEQADASNGKRLVFSYGCAVCHQIGGVQGHPGHIGPPLTNWSQRKYIAGALANTPPSLVKWLMRPQYYEPGSAMPDLGISKKQAEDMAEFLFTQ